MSTDLKSKLTRWQFAGLIDARQAEAIADFEARAAPAGASDGSITATEVITYAGALVTLAGLATLLGTQYVQLGIIGRLAIPGLVAIAGVVGAALLRSGRPRGRRAQTSLVTLSVAAIAVFVGQLQVEIAGGPPTGLGSQSGPRIAAISAVVSAMLAAAFLVRLRAGLLAAEFGLSLLIAAGYGVDWFNVPQGWPIEGLFLGAALPILAAAEFGRRLRVVWATEVLAFIGASAAILPALIAATDQDLSVQVFGGLLALAAFAAAVYRGSAGYALAGGIGLFAFVLDIEFRYFQSSLGFAVSLVISGLALLGIALLLARIVPRLRRSP